MKIHKKEFLLNTSLVLGSILFALVIAELAVRDYHQNIFGNLILAQGGDLISHHFDGLYAHDSRLGWVPSANAVKLTWEKFDVHTLDDGIRSNGNGNGNSLPAKPRPLILAVGDSFTFGDDVADTDTWPAFLQRLTGYRVLNAGVSSYGFDQTILRAEELTPKYKPDILIVSLIYDDIDRCKQYVRHGVPKPYFTVENHRLALKNVPVPFKSKTRLDWFRSIFGYSHLANKLMDRLFPQYWWQDTLRDNRYMNNDLQEITDLLFKRLKEFSNEKTRVILLVQGDVNISETRTMILDYFLAKMRLNPGYIEICNTIPYLLQLKKQKPQEFLNISSPPTGGVHMSAQGNALIAAILKEKILAE